MRAVDAARASQATKATRPFAETAPGVVAYAGDQGARLVQISASRQIAVSDAGSDIFQAICNGNGAFSPRPRQPTQVRES